ncbi:MAG: VCBS repeat-containing protein, partial [Imperialibacter sp.]
YAPQQPFGDIDPTKVFARVGEALSISNSPSTGTGVTYQWQKDAADVPGQTTATLSVPTFAALDVGIYTLNAVHPSLIELVLVSNPREVVLAQETFFKVDNFGIVFNDSLQHEVYAQAWADYDVDGDEDLLVGGYQNLIPTNNTLYRNNGDGTFTSVSAGDLTSNPSDSKSASWADINNDGYPDVFVSDIGARTGAPVPAPVNVFFNNANGTFTTITLPAVANLDKTEGGVWGDYDDDGFVDLLVWGSGNPSSPLVLYKNNGNNTFSHVPAAFGGQVLSDLATASWVDVDNNGALDVYVSGTTGRVYFQNNGDGTFTQNVTSLLVTEPITSSRGHS